MNFQNLKPYLPQILKSLLIAAVLVFGDFLFMWSHFENRYPRQWSATYETFGIALLLTLSFKRRGFYVAVGALLLMAFFQMSHLSYFGTFIHPTKMYLFFTQTGEIVETLSGIGKILLIPFWIFLFSCLCLWGSSLLFRNEHKNWRPLKWILAVAFVYVPVRTYVTKGDYGKQPAIHNLGFSNFYSSFTYFISRTVPYKLAKKDLEVYRSKIEKATDKPKINVVFILGESLRYQNMQLYGYPRATTPHLMEMQKEMPFLFRKAVSAGVCTDVSIPMFFNNYQGTSPMPVVLSQDQCLFKLAKNNGFTTHFYSAQAEGDLKHIVNYLCLASVDHMQIGPGISLMEDIDKRYYDDILLSKMDDIDFNQPNFLVLHQRGSHSPYNLRYPKEKALFPVDENAELGQQMITHYDNSVGFTDQVIYEIVETLKKKSKLPTYVVFTSDHGQILGENKSWGHIDLNEYVFKVPFVFMSLHKDNVFSQVEKYPAVISHQEISDLLVNLLGYRHPGKPPPLRRVFVMGYDLDGLEGGLWVELGEKDVGSVQQVIF